MDDLARLTRGTSEVVTPMELSDVLNQETRTAYIGFEPSGLVHLGWKICADKIRELLQTGFQVTILLADWHAWINDKLQGDLKAIHLCGEYMKDCFTALGIQNVKYVYAQDIVADPTYWELVIKVAKNATLARIRRAMDIMGRQAETVKDLAKYLYPAMQVADMLYLGVDLAYGGMDQRHAHMLCRDVASKIGKKKPVALHTPLLSSLQKGGRMDMVQVGSRKTGDSVVVQVVKMSKSKPGSSIFIHDDPSAITKKLRGAYCPEDTVTENPVLEILQHLIFPNISQPLLIDRKKEHGGPLHYAHYGKLEEDYLQKKIHPLDLKNTVATYLIDILEPVRDYFTHHPQNLQKIQQFLRGGR